MEYKFSDKISSLAPSAIREILKATADPSVIPFAAGNPSPDAFPVDETRAIAADILRRDPITALQYGITEGYPKLIENVKIYNKRFNIGKDFDSLMITTGATQVMDLATKVLCNEGDTVICEEPSFIGSLNCFRSYGCKLAGVPMEADGMSIQKLEETLKTAVNARFIYVIPNFQNPSGATMSLEKRKKVYELALKYNVLILEDNPYGELRVEGEDIPPIKSLDTEGIVIYAGSFSKLFAPGIRVAYALAPKPVIAKMTVGKQAGDVHTPMLTQMIVSEWLENYDLDKHVAKLRAVYGKKLNLMCDCIDKELGDFVSYVRPEGGMFVWCRLPDDVDMLEFVKKAVDKGVAVVPGSAFMMDSNTKTQYIRLNFTTPSNENIVEGVKRLGYLAKEYK